MDRREVKPRTRTGLVAMTTSGEEALFGQGVSQCRKWNDQRRKRNEGGKVCLTKIIVIGATGTISVEVVKALSACKHEVVLASRNSDVKVNLEDSASIRAMFEKTQGVDAVISFAGNAAFKLFADLTGEVGGTHILIE
jgi:nucleoside-diphosphate-sugar epimerase